MLESDEASAWPSLQKTQILHINLSASRSSQSTKALDNSNRRIVKLKAQRFRHARVVTQIAHHLLESMSRQSWSRDDERGICHGGFRSNLR